jgi:hypothetical protein
MRRMGLIVVGLTAGSLLVASAAHASGIAMCVPKREGSVLRTPRHGTCRRGYKLRHLGAEGKQGPQGKAGTAGFAAGEVETLKSVLPYMRFVASGVGGKPTIQFSGVNVQIVNGVGKTRSANGAGNLVIGYDENPLNYQQTGSHDLVLGNEQTFTGFGGIVAGKGNSIAGEFASVTGGAGNVASGRESSISGGFLSSAIGDWSAVSGGDDNRATGEYASVNGGAGNTASAEGASVGGGGGNKASGTYATVAGGLDNISAFPFSAILGGTHQLTKAEFEHIP